MTNRKVSLGLICFICGLLGAGTEGSSRNAWLSGLVRPGCSSGAALVEAPADVSEDAASLSKTNAKASLMLVKIAAGTKADLKHATLPVLQIACAALGQGRCTPAYHNSLL